MKIDRPARAQLATCAVASALALTAAAPPWVAGLVLTTALPAALAASVVVSTRRSRRETRKG